MDPKLSKMTGPQESTKNSWKRSSLYWEAIRRLWPHANRVGPQPYSTVLVKPTTCRVQCTNAQKITFSKVSPCVWLTDGCISYRKECSTPHQQAAWLTVHWTVFGRQGSPSTSRWQEYDIFIYLFNHFTPAKTC